MIGDPTKMARHEDGPIADLWMTARAAIEAAGQV